MKYVYARMGQRFLIFLIDFVLLMVIAGFIATSLERVFGFEPDMMSSYAQSLLVEASAYMTGKSSDLTVFYEYLSKYINYFFVDLGFKLVIELVLVVGLLVVLPKYWGGKTLGRRAANCKLVDKNGNDATIKHFLLRELLGTYLFYCFLGAFFGVIGIVALIVILVAKRSIPDLCSQTYMVNDVPFKVETKPLNDNEVKPDYQEVDSFEQEKTEEKTEEKNEEKEEDSQDKYSIDDDDYKIV